MLPVSIVILTKNDAAFIGLTIAGARKITNDIVIIDSGSTDDTVQIAREGGCRVYHKRWDGYAANKNKGILLCEYDWILSIDAGEVPDEQLIDALYRLNFYNSRMVYNIGLSTCIGDRHFKFGSSGRGHHSRLFNRTLVKWTDQRQREILDIPMGVRCERIPGNLRHHPVKDMEDYCTQSIKRATLDAKKYYEDGERASFIKLHILPLIIFMRNYIALLGFLDGAPGWDMAMITLKHTRLQFLSLKGLEQAARRQPYIPPVFGSVSLVS